MSASQFPVPLELREVLKLGDARPMNARVQRSQALLDYARGLKNVPVPAQLSVHEAASLFEIWMKDKALYGGMLLCMSDVLSL
jgi:small subunit ribosomal protein S29